jgi:hypothetical protein
MIHPARPHTLAALLVATTGYVLCTSAALAATPLTTGLIFEDSFTSGDLTKYNNYFRWGDGSAAVTSSWNPTALTTGPKGTQVRAMKFTYGTWQEVRFSLTSSSSERRGANDSSNVAYPELYTCFDLFTPTNYYHSTSGIGAVNDKWFAVWKNGYQTSNSGVANWVETVPAGGGNSRVVATDNAWGGLNGGPEYVLSSLAYRDPDNTSYTGGYAFRTTERGQWHNYCFHTKVPASSTSRDGLIEVYRDKVLAYAWKNIIYYAPDNDAAKAGFDRGYLMGYHNSTVTSEQTWYLTNFKIGTTSASVGLTGGTPPPAPPTAVQAE